jgi:hypothetical protein
MIDCLYNLMYYYFFNFNFILGERKVFKISNCFFMKDKRLIVIKHYCRIINLVNSISMKVLKGVVYKYSYDS